MAEVTKLRLTAAQRRALRTAVPVYMLHRVVVDHTLRSRNTAWCLVRKGLVAHMDTGDFMLTIEGQRVRRELMT